MLRLVFGKSKSGKSTYAADTVCEVARRGEQAYFLVPDQATFDTEKTMLTRLGPTLMGNVTVLGFSRLCDYVFEKTGYVTGTLADDATKALLMSVALEQVKDSLSIYGNCALSGELVTLMLSTRRELLTNKIDAAAVRSAVDDGDTELSGKLHDIALVMAAFDALVTNRFDDPDGALSVACDLISEHRLFDGTTVVVDSFLSFTPLELDVIERIMTQCSDMLVTLSTDGTGGIFEVSDATAAGLRQLARSNAVTVASPHFCDYPGYFHSPELLHIEENLFRPDGGAYEGPPADTMLYAATDRFDEADFVARNIRRLVIEQGVKYSDIAVTFRDASRYSGVLDTVFDRYDIKSFFSVPLDIAAKPLIKLVNACFELCRSFGATQVLSLLKTGLTSFSDVDIALFENYLFTWSVDADGLSREFTSNPSGFCDEFTTDDRRTLSRIEDIRNKVFTVISDFKKNTADADVRTACAELYRLAVALGAKARVSALCDELESAGEPVLAEEQLRIWEVFCNTLDTTVAAVGDSKFTLRRLCELLNIQFGMRSLSFIPHAVDQVTVGDIERLRLNSKQIVFVIGANDGEFPRDTFTGGIFTNSQRRRLSALGVLPEKELELNSVREQYLCYYALTSAADKLFVSYISSKLTGDAQCPSVMFTELLRLMPDARVHSRLTDNIDDPLSGFWAAQPSFDVYASRVGNSDALTCALEGYYSDNELFAGKTEALFRAVSQEQFRINDSANAHKLFTDSMRLSASKIETYQKCRLMFFCEYGLRIKERRQAQIDSLEYGSFVHYIFEQFFKAHTKTELAQLSKSDMTDEVNGIIAEYADLHFGGLGDKSSRFMHLVNKVGQSSVELLSHMVSELVSGGFTPVDYELYIGTDIPAYELTLPGGETITVTGKIDRVDILEQDGKSYIRIIDYKTGIKTFSLSDVMYGINLQMLLYLYVIESNSADRYPGEVVPAGVLYVPSSIPSVRATLPLNPLSITEKINKGLKMNGLMLDDDVVVNAMEKDMGADFSRDKGGRGKKLSSLASLELFGAVFSRIDSVVEQMATELYAGKISSSPLLLKDTLPCKYCPYIGICSERRRSQHAVANSLDEQQIAEMLNLTDDEKTDGGVK